MKSIFLYFTAFLSLLSFSQTEGNVVPFLEDTVTQFPNVRDLALTEDEAVFSAQSVMGDISVLVYVKQDKQGWSTPEILSFSGRFFDIEPFFSSDGLTLYFASNRPLDSTSNDTKDFDIWFVSRSSKNSKWSAPRNMGAPVNSEMDEFYPVITNSKNIYFTLDNKSLQQKDDIYISEFKNGSYTTPRPLSNAINSEGYEFNAFVAPDESYLIYTCYNRKDGFGSGDLYMSRRHTETNSWSKAKNMGSTVNSDKMDYCPFVDVNSNTLYFTSKRLSSRTSSSAVERIEDLKTLFDVYSNGSSRLYKTKL